MMKGGSPSLRRVSRRSVDMERLCQVQNQGSRPEAGLGDFAGVKALVPSRHRRPDEAGKFSCHGSYGNDAWLESR